MTTRPIPAVDMEEPVVATAPSSAAAPGEAPKTLQDVEREHVLAALARHEGNREATADELGISVRTLYYRLKEYARQGFVTSSSRA